MDKDNVPRLGPGNARTHPYWNVYWLDEFTAFNFNDSSGVPRPEPNPASAVAEAFRIKWPYSPDPYLFSTLAFTLSPLCCAKFLEASKVPVTYRDYGLSKILQFLYVACLDESMDPAYHATVAQRLMDALNLAFPEGSPDLAYLWLLDWQSVFNDYAKGMWANLLDMAEAINTYVPAVEDQGEAASGPETISTPDAEGKSAVEQPPDTDARSARETPSQIIERLANVRRWSMEDLAGEADVGIKQVYKVKDGEPVNVDTVVKLALTLGCPPGSLIDIPRAAHRIAERRQGRMAKERQARG